MPNTLAAHKYFKSAAKSLLPRDKADIPAWYDVHDHANKMRPLLQGCTLSTSGIDAALLAYNAAKAELYVQICEAAAAIEKDSESVMPDEGSGHDGMRLRKR